MKLQLESLKTFWKKKPDTSMSIVKRDKSMMMRFKNLEMSLKIKEEKAWLIKVKLDNFKEFWTRESRKPMTKTERSNNTMKRVTEMIKSLSS